MRSSRAAQSQARRTAQKQDTPLFHGLPPSLPLVSKVQETGKLLKPGPFPHQPNVLSLDFISGCGHGCPFCPAHLRNEGHIRVAANAAERLASELRELTVRPRAVFIS